MFGRKVKLPIDIQFERITEEISNTSAKDYITELKERMEETKEIVEKHVSKAKQNTRNILIWKQKR